MDLPRIELEDEWKPLLRPQKFAKYINDHTVFKAKEGNWRLFGTCADSSYAFYKERYFIAGETNDLKKEMREVGKDFEGGPNFGIKIAPRVFYDDDSQKYHLFFAPMNICHYVADDGINWTKAPDAIRSLWPWLRDPHVIKVGTCYLMYVTDVGNKISVYKSSDLYDWKKLKTPTLTLGDGIPKTINSSCESPVVFPWEKNFILLTTITPGDGGRRFNYTRTLAFVSDNPENFGEYSLAKRENSNYVGSIETHAPEVIKDGNTHYITSCGWRGLPKPVGVKGEGVFIRKFKVTK